MRLLEMVLVLLIKTWRLKTNEVFWDRVGDKRVNLFLFELVLPIKYMYSCTCDKAKQDSCRIIYMLSPLQKFLDIFPRQSLQQISWGQKNRRHPRLGIRGKANFKESEWTFRKGQIIICQGYHISQIQKDIWRPNK